MSEFIAFIISVIIVFISLIAGIFAGPSAKIGGDETPGYSLEFEFRRYACVKHILDTAIAAAPAAAYEIRNIIERWMLTMVNFSEQMIDEVFAEDVFVTDSPANAQMAREFGEKTQLSPAEITALITKLIDVVKYYKGIVGQRHANDGQYTITVEPTRALFVYKGFEYFDSINEYSREIAPERMAFLRSRGSDYQIAQMLLRYASILPGSQHWNMPVEAFRDYYARGVRIEGFASPINAQLVTIDPKCHFCSLFPDVDQPFGSIGSFFKTEFSRDYPGLVVSVGPPYTDELFKRIAAKLSHELKIDPSALFYVTFAAWEDALGYKAVLDLANFAAILPAGKHFYVNTNEPGQSRVTARFNTAFFAVGRREITGKNNPYWKLFDKMAVGKLRLQLVKK